MNTVSQPRTYYLMYLRVIAQAAVSGRLLQSFWLLQNTMNMIWRRQFNLHRPTFTCITLKAYSQRFVTWFSPRCSKRLLIFFWQLLSIILFKSKDHQTLVSIFFNSCFFYRSSKILRCFPRGGLLNRLAVRLNLCFHCLLHSLLYISRYLLQFIIFTLQ